MKVNIIGYGQFEIQIPKKRSKRAVKDLIADAVAQTMDLMLPINQAERFHPVLGKGGYIEAVEKTESNPAASVPPEVPGD